MINKTGPSPSFTVQPDQFNIVKKNGVEIACPKQWQTYSTDTSLVYSVCRTDTIRIVVGVLPSVAQSYYDGLVILGTVNRTTIAGNTAYTSDNTYLYNNYELTNKCITVVQGDTACHIMILCDTSVMDVFGPTFDYVINSLKFIPEYTN